MTRHDGDSHHSQVVDGREMKRTVGDTTATWKKFGRMGGEGGGWQRQNCFGMMIDIDINKMMAKNRNPLRL